MKRNLIHRSAYSAVKSAWPHADRSLSMKTERRRGTSLHFAASTAGNTEYSPNILATAWSLRSGSALGSTSRLQFVWLEGQCLGSIYHSYFAYDGTQGQGCGAGTRVVKQRLAPPRFTGESTR